MVNLGYISIMLGLIVALVFGRLYQMSVSEETLAAAPNLELSLYIYGAASILELLSEPAFVVMQIRLQFGTTCGGRVHCDFHALQRNPGLSGVGSSRGA